MSRSYCVNNKLFTIKKGLQAGLPAVFFVFAWLLYFQGQAQSNYLQSGTSFTTVYTDVHTHYQWGLDLSEDSSFTPTVYPQSKLYLLGVNEACVRVNVPAYNYDTLVYLPKDELAIVKLPNNQFHPFEKPLPRAIFIESTRPITLLQHLSSIEFSLAGPRSRGDNASVIPPNSIYKSIQKHRFFSSGAPRILQMAGPQAGSAFQFYTICSLEENNAIEIKFAMSTEIPSSNQPLIGQAENSIRNLTLNEGEAISYYASGGGVVGQHIKDGYIQSSAPLKLYMFPTNFQVYTNEYSSGAGYEAYRPHYLYESSFHSAPFAGNSGNLYSFLSDKDSTLITINGKSRVLDSLERFDTCMAGDLTAYANRPLFASVVPCSLSFNNSNYASRFLVHLLGDDELITESLFSTINEPGFDNNYTLGITMRTSDTAQFHLDGASLPPGSFNTYSFDSVWSWANVAIDTGVHIAKSPAGFHAIQYSHYDEGGMHGGQSYPSYGYGLAQSIVWPEDSLQAQIGFKDELLRLSDFTAALCPGDSLALNPPSNRFTTWRWTISDTVIRQKAKNKAASTSYIKFKKPGNYWLVLSDSIGCQAPDSVQITVNEAPQAEFEYDIVPTCQGLLLQTSNKSTGAERFMWEYAGQSSTAKEASFKISGSKDSVFYLKLTALSSSCEDSVEKAVKVQPSNRANPIPNFLTPNGDGYNDKMCFNTWVSSSNCFEVKVYNRWGSLVFESRDPTDCWEPRAGMQGVYYYVIKVKGNNFKGSISVL